MLEPEQIDSFLFSAKAHAKVNLHLGVGNSRADGFHELVSVFQSLDVHDTVTLSESEGAAPRGTHVRAINVSGPYAAGVPADQSNLAWRAVDAVATRLAEKFGPLELSVVELELHKEIPAAGGMAGGSADAAAALRLADSCFSRAYDIRSLGEDELFSLAADLGSDVPFTLLGGTALGTGRGEQLTPMLARGRYTWALITSKEGLSTPSVFQKLDELRSQGKGSSPSLDTTRVSQALISGDPERLAGELKNDLQAAALSLRPDLRKVLDVGQEAGALAGIVSGSGPTCAFLCPDKATAAEVVFQVTMAVPGTKGLISSSPGSGAHLI